MTPRKSNREIEGATVGRARARATGKGLVRLQGVPSGGTGRGHAAVTRSRDRIQPYMQLFQIED